MATPAQIAANRRNARHSTGPRTPEGKAAAARNGLRHGLSGRHFALNDEDHARYEALHAQLLREFDPGDLWEALLVSRLAEQMWRLGRIPQMEAELITRRRHDLIAGDQGLGGAWDNGDKGLSLSLLARYETGLERSALRLVQEFRRCRATRDTAGHVAEETAEAAPLSAAPGDEPGAPESAASLELRSEPNPPQEASPVDTALAHAAHPPDRDGQVSAPVAALPDEQAPAPAHPAPVAGQGQESSALRSEPNPPPAVTSLGDAGQAAPDGADKHGQSPEPTPLPSPGATG
jgi:hypothetical protein